MFQRIPTITKYLLIINLLVFLATMLLGRDGIIIKYYGGLHSITSSAFAPYQFITHMFLHANFMHLFFNMFALWMFGCDIEQAWGAKKYLIYYAVCGLGAALCQEVVQLLLNTDAVTIGASGAIFGILLAFGMTFPRRVIGVPLTIMAFVLLDLVNTHPVIEEILSLLNNLFFIAIFITFISPYSPISRAVWRFFLIKPLEARWCVAGYILLEMLFIWKFFFADGVAHMAHLGGALFGYLLIVLWRFMEKKKQKPFVNTQTQWTRPVNDAEYNAKKKQRQDEVDAILDKIRKSGYDSLTKEEKKRLFEASHDR